VIRKIAFAISLIGLLVGLSMWLFLTLWIFTAPTNYNIMKFLGAETNQGVDFVLGFMFFGSLAGFALSLCALFLPKTNKFLVFLLSFLGLLLNGVFVTFFVLFVIAF